MNNPQTEAHIALVDAIVEKWERKPKMTIEVFDIPATGRFIEVWFSPNLGQSYRRQLFGSVSDLCFQISGQHWTYPTVLQRADRVSMLVAPNKVQTIKGDM